MIKKILLTITNIVFIYVICIIFYIISCFVLNESYELSWLVEIGIFVVTIFLYFIEALWKKRKKSTDTR